MPAHVLAYAGEREAHAAEPNIRERKGKARASTGAAYPPSQASATSVADKKPVKSELQDTRIRVEAGGDVIELSDDDDEVPQVCAASRHLCGSTDPTGAEETSSEARS